MAPARAVQVGRNNKYVYVIKPDNTAEVRPVTVRRISQDEVAVEQGLRKDERVVTDGQLRLTDGTKVEIRGGEGAEAAAGAAGEEGRAAGGRLMNISELFIRRPIMTTLVMASILLFGVMAYMLLPVSDLPNVDFPTIYGHRPLSGRQPGHDGLGGGHAAGEGVLDHRGRGHHDLTSMQGTTQITLQFVLTRNIDAAAQDVQAAIARAARKLPPDMPTPPSYRKVNPADQPILYLTLTSPNLPMSALDEFGETMIGPAHLDGRRRGAGAGLRLAEVRRAASRSTRTRWPPKGSASTRSPTSSPSTTSTCRRAALNGPHQGRHAPGQRPAHGGGFATCR